MSCSYRIVACRRLCSPIHAVVMTVIVGLFAAVSQASAICTIPFGVGSGLAQYGSDDEGDAYEDIYEMGPFDSMEIGAFAWIGTLGMNANIISDDMNNLGQTGSDVDYVNDLGLGSSVKAIYLRGAYLYRKTHAMASFDFEMFSNNGNATLTRQIVHGEYIYPAGTDVTVSADMMRIGLHHLWRIKKTRSFKVYAGASFSFISWNSVIDTNNIVQQATTTGLVSVAGAEATTSYPVPMPMLDLRIRYQGITKDEFDMDTPRKIFVDWNTLLFPGVIFNYVNTQLNIGYDIKKRVRIMGGVHILYISGDAESLVNYPLSGTLSVFGGQIGVEAHF